MEARNTVDLTQNWQNEWDKFGVNVGKIYQDVPSGELTFCHGKSPCYSWENPLFLWPFSIANC